MKTRIIQTRFWEDSFIYTISPTSKLLFLYLLTNKRIELTGSYELPIPIISIETGLTKDEILASLNEISSKIAYIDNYVVIKNASKYQNYENSKSLPQRNAYKKELGKLPQTVKDYIDKGFLSTGGTSPQLVTQLDIKQNTKSKIQNTENKNENEKYTKKYFKSNWQELLDQAKNEMSGNPDYYNKDFDRVMREFLDGIEVKDYGYKNYWLAYLKWVRNSKHRVGSSTVGTGKMSIDII